MSRERVSTECDCRQISVIAHLSDRSVSDKLVFVLSSCLFGATLVFRSKREKECLARFPIKDL